VDPIGPDAYGYLAYENGDLYPPSPLYVWSEIDPNLGGAGTLVALSDDQTVNVALPFPVQYYGNAFERVSICSNGLIAMGVVTGGFSSSGEIPGTTGPANMIAGCWADLNPAASGGGKVYRYYDSMNHQFIIEFSHVLHFNSPVSETFEFIIRDQTYNPTLTGDNPIDLMYKEAGAPGVVAVGIQNGDKTIGIQYCNNGIINAAAQGLVAGRAITFTTLTPTGSAVPEGHAAARTALLLARPNPTRGSAEISYFIPTPGRVSLRIFDVGGAVVRTVFNQQLPAGPGSVKWNGKSDRDRDLPAGAYFYRLTGPGFEASRKLVRQ
jgi:hypothetical protein